MTDPARTSAQAPASASKSYDLYFALDGKTFFLTNPNHGVTITDAGLQSCLTWSAEGRESSRLWTDIAAVNMMAGSDGRNEINHCRIEFRGGGTLTVTDANAASTVDHERTPVYRAFVRDLHKRLAQAPAGTIRFSAGATETRYRIMKVAGVIGALFFVGLPFVLLFIVKDWRVLLTLAAGAAFVWPFWKIAEKNRPRSYDPKSPPGELME